MNQPKVSIIVPTYNVSQYLHECMDSILGQTLQEIEVIAVNDGSTDNSLDILREYEAKDSRIKVITKANSAYGHTMNVGLDAATGEYIGIVEPDDWVRFDMYETLFAKAKENDLDFIKADFHRFTGTGKSMELIYNRLCKKGDGYNKVLKPAENIETFRYIMNTWSGIYRREFINKYNIRHNETPGASFQDNGFYFQTFCLADRVMFLDKPFYMNRRDNPNSSVKNREKVYAFTHEYDFILDFLQRINGKKFYGIWLLRKYWNYLFNYGRIDESFRVEFFKKIKEDFIDQKESDLSLFSKGERQVLQVIFSCNPELFCKYFKAIDLAEIKRIRNLSSRKLFKYKLLSPVRKKYREILDLHKILMKIIE